MKRYYTPNKHIISENHLLRMRHNDLIRYILYLQHELDKLYKKCHEYDHNENDHNNHNNYNNHNNNQNHSNALLTLQNKNAMLNKTIIEKNKQISMLITKFDVPKSYNYGLDCSNNFSYSESSSDSGINE